MGLHVSKGITKKQENLAPFSDSFTFMVNEKLKTEGEDCQWMQKFFYVPILTLGKLRINLDEAQIHICKEWVNNAC